MLRPIPGEPSCYHRPAVVYPIGQTPRGNLIRISDTWPSWNLYQATMTQNATTNPYGASDAMKLVESVANDDHTVYNASNPFLVVKNQWYQFQVWAKAAERSKFSIFQDGSSFTSAAAWYDLAGGSVGGTQAQAIARIAAGPNSWYLCQLVAPCTTTSALCYMAIALGLNGGYDETYLGNGASGAYFYRATVQVINPTFMFL